MAMSPPSSGNSGSPGSVAPHAWPVAGLLTVCLTLSYIDRQIISLLVEPIKHSLGLSDTMMGLMQGVSFSLFYVAATLPLARLADRGHRPRIMGTCVAVWSVMTMLCGLASNFWQLLVARIGVAAGEAGLPPAALTVMADMFDARRLARATGLFLVAPFVGGGIALIGGGALYAMSASWDMPTVPGIGTLERWQMIFIIVGAPGLLAALMVYLLSDPKPDRAVNASNNALELFVYVRKEWRFCAVYMMGIAFIVMLFNTHISWLPASIMRSQGVDVEVAGSLVGPIYLIGGSAGTLLAGVVVGRKKDDTTGHTIRFMRNCCVLMLPFAVIGPLMPSLWTQLIPIGIAIFLTSAVVGLASLPFQFVAPKHLRAQMIALTALVAALFGTGLGPLVIGVLSDNLPLGALSLSASLSIVAAVVVPIGALLLHSVSRLHQRIRMDLRLIDVGGQAIGAGQA